MWGFVERHTGWCVLAFCLVGGYVWGLIETVLLWDEPLSEGWTLGLMILPKGAAVAFVVTAIVLSTYDSKSSISSRSSSEGNRE